MKYGIFNTDGLPEGFYDDVIHSTIPSDAEAITDEQWKELLDHPGKRRWDGSNVVELVIQPDLDLVREGGIMVIDNTAEEARERYTQRALQSIVHLEKAEEAADYVAAGYPSDTSNFPFMQAEIEATGKTKEQAADDILTKKSEWISVCALIEKHRLAGKKLVEEATDKENIDMAVAQTTTLLEAV